jgi:hypothetical protein
MSSVRGTISVDVAFTDSTTVSGAQSLKTIVLRDATEYTTGKVAIVTGTCGTAAVNVDTSAASYRNASGDLVSIPDLQAIAFAASGAASAVVNNGPTLHSSGGSIAVSSVVGVFQDSVDVAVIGTAGTASYTLVLYGT